jgi:hypothetical protein
VEQIRVGQSLPFKTLRFFPQEKPQSFQKAGNSALPVTSVVGFQRHSGQESLMLKAER